METKETHYRDMAGNLLWKDSIVFRRLFAVGQELIEDGKAYIVCGCALGDGAMHVNMSPPGSKHAQQAEYVAKRRL